MRRLSNTKLNAITLYLNFIVLAVIGLVSNPLLVRFLGVEAFGIWKACLRLLDLTSVADGRASQALKWIVAHKSLRESEDNMRREVGSAIAVWMLWLPILMTVISVMLWLLPHLIKDIPPADLTAARMAAGLLGANILLTGVMGVPDSVLAGTNQGFRSYIVMTTLLVFSNVAMVLAAWLGYGIIGLGAATVAGSFLTGLCTLLVAYRYVSWWESSVRHGRT
jgi:O-antigen/teichoic acid export membrane protein